MSKLNLLKLFSNSENFKSLINELNTDGESENIYLKNLNGSQNTLLAAHTIKNTKSTHLFILENLEEALYFLDDLNNIIPGHASHLFPSSERRKLKDNNILLEQIEVLNKLSQKKHNTIINYNSSKSFKHNYPPRNI